MKRGRRQLRSLFRVEIDHQATLVAQRDVDGRPRPLDAKLQHMADPAIFLEGLCGRRVDHEIRPETTKIGGTSRLSGNASNRPPCDRGNRGLVEDALAQVRELELGPVPSGNFLD
jgi:hypothetical protein